MCSCWGGLWDWFIVSSFFHWWSLLHSQNKFWKYRVLLFFSAHISLLWFCVDTTKSSPSLSHCSCLLVPNPCLIGQRNSQRKSGFIGKSVCIRARVKPQGVSPSWVPATSTHSIYPAGRIVGNCLKAASLMQHHIKMQYHEAEWFCSTFLQGPWNINWGTWELDILEWPNPVHLWSQHHYWVPTVCQVSSCASSNVEQRKDFGYH